MFSAGAFRNCHFQIEESCLSKPQVCSLEIVNMDIYFSYFEIALYISIIDIERYIKYNFQVVDYQYTYL